jgi:prepilin-type N-terminal cleavage/methylation domain-containing protein
MKKGWTLVETMIVLTIVGLLASIMIGGYRNRKRLAEDKCTLNDTSGRVMRESHSLFVVGDFVTSKLTNWRGQVLKTYEPTDATPSWSYDIRFSNGTNIDVMTMQEFELQIAME